MTFEAAGFEPLILLSQANYFTTVLPLLARKFVLTVDNVLLTKGRMSKWFQICTNSHRVFCYYLDMPTVAGFKPSYLWSWFNYSTIVFLSLSKKFYRWYMIFHWQTSSKNFAILLILKPSNLRSQFNCSTVLFLLQSKNFYRCYMIFHWQKTEGQSVLKSVAQTSNKLKIKKFVNSS